MINRVIFYHHWHFGDGFVTKEYIRFAIRRLSQLGIKDFKYTHPCGPKALADLETEYIPWEVGKNIIPSMMAKIVIHEGTLFINTWIGPYFSFFKPTQHHGNFETLSITWKCLFMVLENTLSLVFGKSGSPVINLITNSDNLDASERLLASEMLPKTNWTFYNTAYADNFLKDRKDVVLFCNSLTASEQTKYSGIELLENVINYVASKNPNTTFVCTKKILINNPNQNIFFTDDIFKGVIGGDLNEIAYLSTFCKMIIGKSSGPYTFCHVNENIMRDDCTFYCITDRQSDCLLYNFFDAKCNNYFFIGKEETTVCSTIDEILNGKLQAAGLSQFAIIQDNVFTNLHKQIDCRNH